MSSGSTRRLTGLGLCLLLTGSTAALAMPAVGTAGAPRTTDTTATLPVQVFIDALAPRVVRPHALITVSGQLKNIGAASINDVRVRVRVRSRAVGSRSELATDAVSTDPLGDPLETTTTPVRATMGAGATAPFHLQVAADDLHLGGFGVYPFAMEVLGAAPGGPNDIVGRTPTFLPWAPPSDPRPPVRMAWVVPLVDPPNRAASTVFPDDHLATALRPGGRLLALLAAGTSAGPGAVRQLPVAKRPPDSQRAVPVTWAVDPALLESIADMADTDPKGYRVASGHGHSTVPGTGHADAVSWLDAFRHALQGGPVADTLLALPYADVDVQALARAGLDGDVTKAMSHGQAVATSIAGTAPDRTLSYPPGGYVRTKTLDDLAASGARTFLLRDDALPLTESLTYTPNAGAPLETTSGKGTALLYDGILASIVATADRDALTAAAKPAPLPTATPTDESPTPSPTEQPPTAAPTTGRLLEQRFLAETALIAAERFVSRDVVVAPPADWDPAPGLATALIEDTGRVPWIAPTSLRDMHADDSIDRGPLNYPDAAVQAELPQSYLADPRHGIGEMRRDLTTFRSILVPPIQMTAVSLDAATMRAESAAWRDDLSAGIALRDQVASDLKAKLAAVNITSSRRLITLASRRATIPITISNDLDQAVVVRLRLTAVSSARLSAPVSLPQTIPAGRKLTYEVKAVVNQAGLFPIKAQLLTPDGETYGPPVTLRLRSTAYGQLALGITAGALGALFLAIVIRLVRRARRRRAAAAAT